MDSKQASVEASTAKAMADKPAGFRTELARCWTRVPDKALFLCLFGAWLFLFQFLGNSTFGYVDTPSLMRWMANAYVSSSGEDGHGPLIPALVLVLFWWKREELLALRCRTWLPALGLLAVALGLHVVGYLVQQPRISIVALFTGMYALIGLVWGPAWLRASFFPFFLFVFSIPVASISEPITLPMRLLVSRLVELVSSGLGIDVIREGTQLFNAQHSYRYEIAAACSGLRSVMAIVCLATIYAFMNFNQNWKRWLIITAAFPLSVVGNVLRLMCVIVTAEFSGQAAGDFVHDNFFFSLLPYLPAMAGFMILGRWLREPEPERGMTRKKGAT